MKDVTFVIKTFERPECLNILIKSIRSFYPNVPIVVADDSKSPIDKLEFTSVRLIQLPFDVGLSRGRNELIHLVTTKYVLMLDDDFVFDEATNIELFYSLLESNPIDLIAGNIIENGEVSVYDGLIEVKNNCLKAFPGQHSIEKNYRVVDLTLNFFLAHTDALRRVCWDDTLKVGEHLDFFLRAKTQICCAHTANVTISHQPVRNHHYNQFKNRAVSYMIHFMKKHNLNKIDARAVGGDLWTPKGVVLAVEEIASGKRNAFKNNNN